MLRIVLVSLGTLGTLLFCYLFYPLIWTVAVMFAGLSQGKVVKMHASSCKDAAMFLEYFPNATENISYLSGIAGSPAWSASMTTGTIEIKAWQAIEISHVWRTVACHGSVTVHIMTYQATNLPTGQRRIVSGDQVQISMTELNLVLSGGEPGITERIFGGKKDLLDQLLVAVAKNPK